MIRTISALHDIYSPITQELEQVEVLFDRELTSGFDFVSGLCERVQRYRGKMLRPTLVLLTAKACGRLLPEHTALATVVEMVHVATLVHDDVLDEAEIRRQQATINASNGNETAVLLGDYLMSHAFHLVAGLPDQYAARRMGAITNTVCEGELLQVHHEGDTSLTEEQYMQIISRKTASLTGVSCEFGARYAGVPAEAVDAWQRFGQDVGLAFQIIDDILDYVGAEDRMGKTLGRDLDLGKPTLPAIHALHHAAPEIRRKLAAVLGNGRSSTREQIAQWLQEAGSLEYGYTVAQRYVSRAREHLETVAESPARQSLIQATNFILRREH